MWKQYLFYVRKTLWELNINISFSRTWTRSYSHSHSLTHMPTNKRNKLSFSFKWMQVFTWIIEHCSVGICRILTSGAWALTKQANANNDHRQNYVHFLFLYCCFSLFVFVCSEFKLVCRQIMYKSVGWRKVECKKEILFCFFLFFVYKLERAHTKIWSTCIL